LNGKRWILAFAILLVGASVLAGCGGGSSSTTAGSSGGSETSGGTESSSESSGGSSSGSLGKMEKNVEFLLGPNGTFKEEPTTSPVRADSSRSIQIISCGQEITACSNATGAAEKAAHLLGWKTSLFDAKSEYSSAQSAIRNAIAQKVDGIFVYLIDCQYLRASLEEAKKAGIPVVAAEARDCNESEQGSPSLFTYIVHYEHDKTYPEYLETYFRSAAEYAIVEANGESNALSFLDDVPAIEPEKLAVEATYAECEKCELEVIQFPVADYGTKLQGLGEQNLLKNPDVNTVLPSYEAAALEIFPAVRSSGRESQILTFMGEGSEQGLEVLRQGTHTYAFNWPVKWEGWAGVDALGRIFLNQEPVHTGQGSQLINAENNLSPSGPGVAPVDFEAMYEKAWQVK
jgi:ribose transport system substrate-binding protein